MKVLACLLVVLFAVSPAAARSSQRQARISIAASTVDVRESQYRRDDVQLLWNRNIRPTPIGNAVMSCFKLGTGGILGRGVQHCVATYVLPEGKIAAQGILHSHERYTLAITGGTGTYFRASGYLFARRVGPGTLRLIFNL